MQPTVAKIGARLRELREERFLSHRELAQRAGVSPTTILKLETPGREGETQRRTVRKLAAALGVEPKDLLNREEL